MKISSEMKQLESDILRILLEAESNEAADATTEEDSVVARPSANDTAIRDAMLTAFATYMGRRVYKEGKLASDPDGRDHAVDLERYQYSPEGGLFLIHRIRTITKRGPHKGTHYIDSFKTIDRKSVATSLDKIATEMFGDGHGGDDISTAASTWEMIKKAEQLSDTELFNMCCGSIRNILESQGISSSSLPSDMRKSIEHARVNPIVDTL